MVTLPSVFVPVLVSNVPEPLMPPVSEPFDNRNWPAPLMVKTPANVALPLSVNVPPTFMSSIDSVAPLASETFPVAVIEFLLPESA